MPRKPVPGKSLDGTKGEPDKLLPIQPQPQRAWLISTTFLLWISWLVFLAWSALVKG